jgi:predicted dehydrogenase
MKTRPSRASRRQFLKLAAAVSAPYFTPARVWSNAPSDRLSHAAIGTDGMGWADLTSLASHPRIEIVALCDVDLARTEKARQQFPQARVYQDWRELLEKEGDRIDSVNVSVPDHMHAPISMAAMARGKHVYCQKPLTHEVAEARAMRLAREKAQVVTQMGNQIQSESVYRTAVKMVRDGLIGKVKELHAWTSAKYTQGPRPAGEDPVPATLNWDGWVGVAPMRPFKAGVYHSFNWRCWQDFGTGSIGDFGCHILDSPFKALDLKTPRTIRAEVPQEWADNEARRRESWPDWEIIHYEFEPTEFTTGETLPVTWYDSGKQPPREAFGEEYADASKALPGSGALFIGEEGRLLLPHIGEPQLLQGSRRAGEPFQRVESIPHYHGFVDACLGNGTTGSNFDYAGPLTEATLLGSIAVRVPGQTLAWDAANLRFKNSEEAQQMVARKYREGWREIA